MLSKLESVILDSVAETVGVTEATWREGDKKDPNSLKSESPPFVGRAIAALAADTHVIQKSSFLTSSAELSREYGFKDPDGRRRDFVERAEEIVGPDWFVEYGNWYRRVMDLVMRRWEQQWELLTKNQKTDRCRFRNSPEVRITEVNGLCFSKANSWTERNNRQKIGTRGWFRAYEADANDQSAASRSACVY